MTIDTAVQKPRTRGGDLIPVTLPGALRAPAFGHQAVVYGALMRCVAALAVGPFELH
jgi:hypothetical protein